MKTENLIKFFTICLALSSASALSAKNPFQGKWTDKVDGMAQFEIDSKKIKARMSAHHGQSYTGTYKVQDETLHYTLTAEEWGETGKGEKGTCKIEKLKDHLSFQEELKCTGPIGEYFHNMQKRKIFGKPLSDGTVRKLDGREVLTFLKEGKVNDAANYRSAPDVSSKPIHCMLSCGDECSGPPKIDGPVIPKGIDVNIIAKTKTKVKVQKWENYWYYVDIKWSWEESCKRGWIYGEFITIH